MDHNMGDEQADFLIDTTTQDCEDLFAPGSISKEIEIDEHYGEYFY